MYRPLDLGLSLFFLEALNDAFSVSLALDMSYSLGEWSNGEALGETSLGYGIACSVRFRREPFSLALTSRTPVSEPLAPASVEAEATREWRF